MPATTPEPDDPRAEGAMRREIGVVLGVALVVNATIGTGIFKKPADVVRLAGSLDAALFVWIAGAVVALSGALTLAELAAAIPRTGGMYEYLRRGFGPWAAFLFGWAKLTLLIPSAVGSFARLAAEAAAALLGWPPDATHETALALGFLAACTAANLLGVRASATEQAVVTVAKYAGVALLAVLGLAAALPVASLSSVGPAALPPPLPFHAAPTLLGCAAAMVSVMWAYDGWADLANLSGEMRAPARSLPRALIAGTFAICVVYVAANVGYARLLGLDGLRRSTTGPNMAAANLAVAAIGAPGQKLISALVLVSCIGGCMSSLLVGSRVLVPLATDGLFVRWLGRLSPRTRVPSRAVVVSALLGGAYVSVRDFKQLTDAFVVGYFPFYILAVLSVFVLRRREPLLVRPFRVPAYPLPPLVFLAGAGLLLWGAAADIDRTTVFAFGVLLAGVPVGWVWRRFAAPRVKTAPASSG